MRIMQADRCLNSKQIDTLFISVGGQERGLGGGVFWAGGPKFTRDCHFFFTLLSCVINPVGMMTQHFRKTKCIICY